MESIKMVLKNLFAGQQWRNRHTELTYWHGEKGEEGEMYGKSNMDTYITICKIDSQLEFAVWLRKLKQGLCINLERWDEEGMGGRLKREGIYVYLWLIHIDCVSLFILAARKLREKIRLHIVLILVALQILCSPWFCHLFYSYFIITRHLILL